MQWAVEKLFSQGGKLFWQGIWENYFKKWENYFCRWENYFCRWENYCSRSGRHPTIPSSPRARSAQIPDPIIWKNVLNWLIHSPTHRFGTQKVKFVTQKVNLTKLLMVKYAAETVTNRIVFYHRKWSRSTSTQWDTQSRTFRFECSKLV